MYTAGYYKTNPRALRLREVARMTGRAFRVPLSYFQSRFAPARGGNWMPGLWAETECRKEEMSDRFWEFTSGQRDEFERLGFQECGFCIIKQRLDPTNRGSGRISYLDRTRSHVGLLAYANVSSRAPGVLNVETVVTAFTAVFPSGPLSCTNNKNAFDPPPGHRVIRIATGSVEAIYDRFLKEVHAFGKPPLNFPDQRSFEQWYDANQLAVFEDRVRRGLFIRMTDAEVEQARRKFPPPLTVSTG